MPYEWIPYALSAVASAAGSAFQNSGSASSQKRAFGYQQRLMYEQAQLNQQMANNMFQAENEYNHPVAMMSRELKAGMNPYAIAQQLGAGRSVPADGAAASASQGSSPVGAPYQAPFNNMSADIANVSNAIKAIADAKKANIDTTSAEENLQIFLEQQKQQLEKQKLDNNYQRIANDIYERTGDKTQQLIMQKVAGEILLNFSESKKNFASISEIQQNIKESISRMNLNDKNAEALEKQIPWLAEKIQSEINTINKQGVMYEKQGNAALISADAARTSAYAVAQNQLEQAKTESALRDSKKGLLDAQQSATKADMLFTISSMYVALERLGMDKEKFVPELQNLKNQVLNGKIKNAQEFVNLLYLPFEKNVHMVKEGSEAFENLVPW